MTLWDVEDGDATLACWPKSHKYHEGMGNEFDLSNSRISWNRGDYQQMGNEPYQN